MAIQSCVNNDVLLASAYWNFGRTLQKIGKNYSAAKFLIETSLRLSKNCPKLPSQTIEARKTAFIECEQSLADLSQHVGNSTSKEY